MAKKSNTVKVKRFCKCGDSAIGSMSPHLVPKFDETWERIHSGEGHGPATPAEARKVRRAQTKDAIASL